MSQPFFIFFKVVFIFSFFFEVVFIFFIFFRSSSFLIFLLRLFSFFFWGRLSSWVKIRLHTENQLPRLPGSALKVPVWWWVVGGGFLPILKSHSNSSWGWVGLWQKHTYNHAYTGWECRGYYTCEHCIV